jgi:hypothetical protein
LQSGGGPSLENIPDKILLLMFIKRMRCSTTTKEILEAASFSSAISKLVFMDNIFKQSKNTI